MNTNYEHMAVYESKNRFVKDLFWKRIQTAINLGQINDRSIILDLGCNTGHLLKTIRKFNSRCECCGVDIEPKIMEIPNCTFKVGDARSLPLPDSYFTVVFILDILEHIKNVEIAIKEIHRVLMPNGHAILCGPTESWFYRLCRFIQFGQFKKNVECDKPGFRGEIDYHFHTIYDLEEKFVANAFKEVKSQSLPGIPFPTLFRVTKFQKEISS
jgi:ubiquinone/menaquinone biosynthesis C-methylase UbiE